MASSITGGSRSAKRRGPFGEPSVVTAVTGAPHRAEASRSGWPMVAELNTKRGIGPVVTTQPTEPAQHVGDVGAEDAPQHVQLVDHDVAQAHQQGIPLGVAGEEASVEHLGIGEHDVGVVADPGLLLGRGVAVVGTGDEVGEPEGGE